MVRQLDGGIMVKEQRIKSALEIIEAAVFILRNHFLSILSVYFIGSLPFVTAFLYFWTDMSQSAFASEHIISASLSLALLFIWMKCWHVVFCRKVISHIRLQPAPRWSLKQIFRLISSQSFFAGCGAIILPIAMILTLPFGWIYTFYQNIYQVDNGSRPLKDIIKKSWYSAKLWPGQNHIILCIISVFSIFVFLNICVGIYILPVILKKFLGMETVFTLSGTSIFNTTFLAVASGLTYLAVDPLIKTVYALRSFYVFSVKSGDDLRTDILHFKVTGNLLSYLVLFAVFSVLTSSAIALAEPNTQGVYSSQTKVISSDKLDSAIEKTLKQREYTWRMPKEIIDEDAKAGSLDIFALWVKDKLKFLKTNIKSWWKQINNWFKKLFPDRGNQLPSGGLWHSSVYFILYITLALLLCALALIIWRQFQNRKNPAVRTEGQAIPSTPDLTNDFVDPVELPVERWLNMGYELMRKQNMRLALRAFYLAVLSHLADKNLITIARYKTNMDYVLELKRRAHEHHELINLFSLNVRVFDKSWYGMHEVTAAILENFIDNRERMISIAHG